jgi:hypothetical protein
VLAEVTIQMIPYTTIQLDLGHQPVVAEDGTHRRAHDDRVYTVHVLGFENTLDIGRFAIDGERRGLYLLLVLLLIVVVIYTGYVFILL